jgi:hypothetical protein
MIRRPPHRQSYSCRSGGKGDGSPALGCRSSSAWQSDAKIPLLPRSKTYGKIAYRSSRRLRQHRRRASPCRWPRGPAALFPTSDRRLGSPGRPDGNYWRWDRPIPQELGLSPSLLETALTPPPTSPTAAATVTHRTPDGHNPPLHRQQGKKGPHRHLPWDSRALPMAPSAAARSVELGQWWDRLGSGSIRGDEKQVHHEII